MGHPPATGQSRGRGLLAWLAPGSPGGFIDPCGGKRGQRGCPFWGGSLATGLLCLGCKPGDGHLCSHPGCPPNSQTSAFLEPEPCSRQTASTWLTVLGPLLGGVFLSCNPRQHSCRIHVGAPRQAQARGTPHRQVAALTLITWLKAIKQESRRAGTLCQTSGQRIQVGTGVPTTSLASALASLRLAPSCPPSQELLPS